MESICYFVLFRAWQLCYQVPLGCYNDSLSSFDSNFIDHGGVLYVVRCGMFMERSVGGHGKNLIFVGQSAPNDIYWYYS